jgi:hypothetical protein
MAIEASEMETTISLLREMRRGDWITQQASLTLFRDSKEAPFSMSRETTSVWPQRQASDRGVFPA